MNQLWDFKVLDSGGVRTWECERRMSGCLDQWWEITEVLEADSVPQLMWVKQCHKAPMTGNG